jgi:GT2 family glycosyltransferase
MKINELISSFEIYINNEEKRVLEKLKDPLPLNSFEEHDQFVIEGLIRKSLVTKIGHFDPKVVANEL